MPHTYRAHYNVPAPGSPDVSHTLLFNVADPHTALYDGVRAVRAALGEPSRFYAFNLHLVEHAGSCPCFAWNKGESPC